MPVNVRCSREQYNLENLKGNGTPFSFEVELYSIKDLMPYLNEGEILVTYNNFSPNQSAKKDPRSAFAKVQLPFTQFCQFADPIKQADFKLTIQSNKEIPSVNELFEDVCAF